MNEAYATAASLQAQSLNANPAVERYAGEAAVRKSGLVDCAIENHHGIVQRLNGLCERLERVADRVFGATPSTGQTAGPRPPGSIPTSQVSELSAAHDAVNDLFSRAYEVVERIERV